MAIVCCYPDGPGPPSTAVTALEAATHEFTRILSTGRPEAIHLDRDQPLTFRDREIYKNAGYRLCPLLEDRNDYARREQAEKRISIKEFGARP